MPEPPPDRAALRTALLEQLAYLLDEVELLRVRLRRVPALVLETRPYGDGRSILDLFGLIAAADTQYYRPAFEQLQDEEAPRLPRTGEALQRTASPEPPSLDALLDRVQAARTGLLEVLKQLPAPAWTHEAHRDGERLDAYALAHELLQFDTDLLRIIGYRLHESNLTERPQDLPK